MKIKKDGVKECTRARKTSEWLVEVGRKLASSKIPKTRKTENWKV
jgi:hypothetical protein